MIASLIGRFRAWRFWRQVRADLRREHLAAIDDKRDLLCDERTGRHG